MSSCYVEMRSSLFASMLALVSLSSCGDGGADAPPVVQASAESSLNQAMDVANPFVDTQCEELHQGLMDRCVGIPYFVKDGEWWARHWTLEWQGESEYKDKVAEAFGNHLLSPSQLVMALRHCVSNCLAGMTDIERQLGIAPQEPVPMEDVSPECVRAILKNVGFPENMLEAGSLSTWADYDFELVMGRDLANLTIWLNEDKEALSAKVRAQMAIFADKVRAATRCELQKMLDGAKNDWSQKLVQ